MKRARSLGKKNYQPLLLVCLLLVALLVMHEVFGQHGWFGMQRERRRLEALEQEIQRLQQENEALQSEINALKSDPKAIERAAREQMHMARPGEVILTLPAKDHTANLTTTK